MNTKYEIMQKLQTLIGYYPNLRFGQLIAFIDDYMGKDMFYIEDDEFLKIINIMLEGLK